jgi:hypothetical protein
MILELYGNSKLGVAIEMVIKEKQEFLFGACHIEIEKRKRRE